MSATRTVTIVRFENINGPQVFWRELILDGVKVLADAGRTDTKTNETQRTDKSGERFATVAEAQQRFDELVRQSSTRYKRQTRREEERAVRVEGLSPVANNPELEAQLLTASDGKSAAAVYADWLQTHGDARGELAALFQGGRPDEAAAWLAANAELELGELDVKLDTELYDLDWRDGFLRGASLRRRNYDSRTDLAALTRALLALPVARFVTALRFGLASFESDNDWSATMRAIVESAQAGQLTSLRFDDYDSEDCELSWTPFGDFSTAWAALPALEELRIRSGGGGTLGDLALPNLKTLVRVSGGLAAAEITSIMNARCPQLEHLEVWFGSTDYGAEGTVEHLQPLLEGRLFPSLRHLGLVNCELSSDLVRPLATSPILSRLRSLDLSKGVLVDRDVDVLLEHAGRFAHLERLDLSENLLNERGDELAARLPNAVVADQRWEEDMDPDEGRYVAVGE